MKEQEEKIAQAALRVFSRYGFSRTTMSDIAKEAGLVRQTLYTVYSGKDDVLRAAIRYFSEQSLIAIQDEWRDVETLAEKLDIYFEHAIIRHFSIIRSSPDAQDMITGYNAAGKAEIARMQTAKTAAIAGILQPFQAGITARGLSVGQLADFILSAATDLRLSARDEAHLKELLGTLKLAVLALAVG